ncbi:MAG: hypothetical protein HY788_16870 [Deltaproteobacteria bacterium]|nr:hypothetical protein [Deltaproteobacteria bacterium]
MDSSDNSSDRRRQKRLVPKVLAFAAMAPSVEKLGKLKNISQVGLAFEYVSHGREDRREHEAEIALFMKDGEFYIKDISCTVIYDLDVARENTLFVNPFEQRCCGVKFNRMPPEKAFQLESFLNKYAVDPEGLSADEIPL